MQVTHEVNLTPEQVAEALYEMDTGQLAEVFVKWNHHIEKAYREKPNHWPDLGACLMWVASHTDENPDLHEAIRAMYAASLATLGVCKFEQNYKP